MFESYLIFTFRETMRFWWLEGLDSEVLTGARDGSVSISELKTLESKAKIPKVRIQGGWVAKVD